MWTPRLEIPIFGPASASPAVSLGAARLELNAAGSYPLGGTTPSASELGDTAAAAALAGSSSSPAASATLRVMIRPRGPPADGSPDFLYASGELAEMREAIVGFGRSGLLDPERGDGFVFGVLRRAGGGGGGVVVDVERNAELVRLAWPFKCVFHRAFDDVVGSVARLGQGGGDGQHQTTTEVWKAALEDVIDCGFSGVLTSGGPGTAPGNALVLNGIVAGAKERIEVVVGGGVRSTNVRDLALAIRHDTSPVWFHSSCLTSKDGGEEVDGEEVRYISRELGLLQGEGSKSK
ncbi:putative copper homeostasis protein cutc [Phialemonium atrogriseum]|uniref:Copper homeostasis protein cutC homolog n=1 Tax=Phialemonium atrogriseum TaxID=1093897 RepID=A0AAJ0C1V5_9PEZI|nr:putative copper homeostasis protein cutc [Phialemonium atrogriseum]KAK1766161.1 putative copper homeostasis protein cutc [Phialemonium atrogriseum]